jgi:hypothetical protein
MIFMGKSLTLRQASQEGIEAITHWVITINFRAFGPSQYSGFILAQGAPG